MKIVCDNKIPFIKGVFEPFAQVVYLKGCDISRRDVLDADALIVRTRTRCDEALLKGTSVKMVATATIGIDHIDTAWCDENGILWANAPGCNAASVCQWVGSTLEALSYKLGFELKGLTLGIIGVGHVGSKVVELAKSLNMKALICDPPLASVEGREDFVSLDDIVRDSDVITIHAPLTHDTFHLFDDDRLNLLSREQVLINSARGEVVDNQALKRCLCEKRIRGAALDVWENEPEIDEELLNLVTIGTPHIAGYSTDGKANGTEAVVRAVAKVFGISELENWELKNLPEGDNSVYDVLADDAALRRCPKNFELLRSDYRIRREPGFKIY